MMDDFRLTTLGFSDNFISSIIHIRTSRCISIIDVISEYTYLGVWGRSLMINPGFSAYQFSRTSALNKSECELITKYIEDVGKRRGVESRRILIDRYRCGYFVTCVDFCVGSLIFVRSSTKIYIGARQRRTLLQSIIFTTR